MMKKNSNVANILGIPLTCIDWHGILKNIEIVIRKKNKRKYISITNTESMYHAIRNPGHFRFIKKASFSLCDGIGAVIAGYAWGHKIPRLNGPILMLKACEYGQKYGWRHFFYGGKEGVADKMVLELKKKYPKLISAGTHCPPFRSLSLEEDQQVIKQIIDSKPDIVWVGLGLLKQEQWIAEHLKKINVPWMCGVGAAFDYHSGTVPWAPEWIQKIGMEWLFRTFIQPRLRIKRYYWSFIFMFEAIFEGLRYKNRIKRC